jgi:16S rRNA (guanine966-N2)-methyltransferase
MSRGGEFLDLYSGTGSLAIEALSRGASHVLSVESHPKSISVMRQNKEKLSIGSEWSFMKKDVFNFLRSYSGEGFDVILIDPPFTLKIADKTMQSVAESEVFSDSTVIFIESSKQEHIGESYKPLNCIDRRTFGDKLGSFFAKGQENEDT